MPVAIYFVGQVVFGEYGGNGFGSFAGNVGAKIAGMQPVAWFMVLAPYLLVQTARLTLRGWRMLARPS